ncbi:hypothetical protein FHG87_018935 [Trinorchestia longiramus]|nr:hypothetical protein FHG87_018935 [Trinorchestia longiramus]
MSGHAQAAVPSQLPYIMGQQCSASHTLHQELRKSTYPLRTLITCRNQHTTDNRLKEEETSHPALTPSKTQHKDIQCLLGEKRSLKIGTGE